MHVLYIHALQQLTCTCIANGHSYSLAEDGNERCVSQQELQSCENQLTYWQNTTLTVIKDHVSTGEVDVHVL